MLSLTAEQQAIIDSPVKAVSWLFDVVDKNLSVHRWSTKRAYAGGIGGVVTDTASAGAYTDTTQAGVLAEMVYDFKIINFSGVSLSRPRTESGIMPPAELSFSAINKDNVFSADDFEGGYVTLSLYMGDGSGAEIKIRAWKFLVKKVEGSYQQLDFTCEDFFQQYIDGEYPGAEYRLESVEPVWAAGIAWQADVAWTLGTEATVRAYGMKVRDLFPSADGDIDDDRCVPLPFGECYIPIRSAYIIADRFYALGPTIAAGGAVTYSIAACRTPRDYSAKTEYTSPAYGFDQYTKISDEGYSVQTMQAMIAPGPANGLFEDGDHYFDLPVKFTRSDTATVTNPADVIEYVLKDMGVAAADIDATTFAAAGATYDSWSLAFNGAFWRVIPREKALTLLLAMCHSTLIIGETLELHVLDSAAQKIVTSAHVMKGGDVGIGTFSYSAFTRELSDCGSVAYSPTADSQDIGVNALVSAKSSRTHIDPEPFSMPFVQDATIAANIARLYLQRKLLKKSEERFTGKASLIALQPSDFVSMSGGNYGGLHSVIIDSMRINKDVSIDFVCTGFSDTVENYGGSVTSPGVYADPAEDGVVTDPGYDGVQTSI